MSRDGEETAHALHGPGDIQRGRRAGDLSPGARAGPPHARGAAVCLELGRSRFPAVLPAHGDGGRVAVRPLDPSLGGSGGFRGDPGPHVRRGGSDHERVMRGDPMKTLQQLFGIELPVIQAPMAGVQGSALAVAVSNAGGLGSLPCAMLSVDALRKELEAIRSQTSRPYNVNFFCHTPPAFDAAREASWRAVLAPYYEEHGIDPRSIAGGPGRAPFTSEAADVLEEFRPPVVSFHFGLPAAALLERVRSWGAKILSSATTVEEALWLEDRGVGAGRGGFFGCVGGAERERVRGGGGGGGESGVGGGERRLGVVGALAAHDPSLLLPSRQSPYRGEEGEVSRNAFESPSLPGQGGRRDGREGLGSEGLFSAPPAKHSNTASPSPSAARPPSIPIPLRGRPTPRR